MTIIGYQEKISDTFSHWKSWQEWLVNFGYADVHSSSSFMYFIMQKNNVWKKCKCSISVYFLWIAYNRNILQYFCMSEFYFVSIWGKLWYFSSDCYPTYLVPVIFRKKCCNFFLRLWRSKKKKPIAKKKKICHCENNKIHIYNNYTPCT